MYNKYHHWCDEQHKIFVCVVFALELYLVRFCLPYHPKYQAILLVHSPSFDNSVTVLHFPLTYS